MQALERQAIRSSSTTNARNPWFGRQAPTPFFQPKLTVNTPGDAYEQEADAVADQVMRMQEGDAPIVQRMPLTSVGDVQRKCAACEQEEQQAQRKESGGGDASGKAAPGIVSAVLSSGSGRPIEGGTRQFMESRFGQDFGQVRVHTDSRAAESASAIQAHAYTSGRDIVFGAGQYKPESESGKRLLAHELAHVGQQRVATQGIQRRVIEDQDTAGSYRIDDNDCTFQYNQNWYFNFPASMNEGRRAEYMRRAGEQVSQVWSGKFPLKPGNSTCSCSPDGFEVEVGITPSETSRQGRHGYTVNVTPNEPRGWTHPHTSNIDLSERHDQPVGRDGIPGGQRVIAHEFGHAIGITDEYVGWAALWGTEGSQDQEAIMHSGDEVRPRHYQPFADMLNVATGGECNYQPNGVSTEYENPTLSLSTLPVVQGQSGRILDRRFTARDSFGVITPTVGLISTPPALSGTTRIGPQAGLRLNQLAHPLTAGVRVGATVDPANPLSPPQFPLTIDLGIRTRDYSIGAQYAPIFIPTEHGLDVTHAVGVGGTF